MMQDTRAVSVALNVTPSPSVTPGNIPVQRALRLLQGAADASNRADEADRRDRPSGEAHHR